MNVEKDLQELKRWSAGADLFLVVLFTILAAVHLMMEARLSARIDVLESAASACGVQGAR